MLSTQRGGRPVAPEGYVGSEELLFGRAIGALPESASLAVAAHAALCPEASSIVHHHKAVAGALIETLDPAALDEGALDRALKAIEAEGDAGPVPPAAEPARDGLDLPSVLRSYVGPDIEALRWKRVMKGVREAELPVSDGEICRTRLMHIDSGQPVLQHGHNGLELTLLLQGAYGDCTGEYRRGDLQVADEEIDHKPVAFGGEDCLCLVVTDAPIRFTGPFGRLLNLFVRYK